MRENKSLRSGVKQDRNKPITITFNNMVEK
jgi:hypothetical protein